MVIKKDQIKERCSQIYPNTEEIRRHANCRTDGNKGMGKVWIWNKNKSKKRNNKLLVYL